MKDIVVLYHQNCSDGFSGAWVAWKKFKDKADYIAVEHNSAPLPGLEKKEIYMIDFCYPTEIMRRLLTANKKIVVLDHHESQVEAMKVSSEYVYDVGHSGCVIAWNYFFPKKSVPKLLAYVEDMDLWHWKLPNAKELLASLGIKDFDLKIWNKAVSDFEDTVKKKKYIEEGKILLKYQDNLVDEFLNRAEKVMFEGEVAYAVNSSVLASEIGNKIVKVKDAIGIIWYYKKNRIIVSLRANGKVDVSELAMRYGGGGHKSASGFAFDAFVDFPWTQVK